MIEQTKTRRQETLEFQLNEQMESFSFSPPLNLVEEGRCLLGLTNFERLISVFNITGENNSFSITIPGHWETEFVEKTIDELYKISEFRSLELHVKEVGKRRNQIKIGDNEFILSDFETQKKVRHLNN